LRAGPQSGSATLLVRLDELGDRGTAGQRSREVSLKRFRAGTGRDVRFSEGGEVLITRRCGTEPLARYCPEAMRQDTVRRGWRDGMPDPDGRPSG